MTPGSSRRWRSEGRPAVPDADVLAAAAQLAKPRAIEHLAPGSWLLVDYADEQGNPTVECWTQVRLTQALTGEQTGTQYVRIEGVDTDGDFFELGPVKRGSGIPKTLRAAEARKIGLEVPHA